jgi:phosphoglycerate dehydrogenase-like enzyme
MGKKILFMTARQAYVPMFWNETCESKCREYGFTVDLPSREGDLDSPDWSAVLSGYDGLITTWGSPVCTGDFLKQAPNVKVIGHCAGSAVAVTDATTYDSGVKVTTANPVMAEAVAEWSLMATLVLQRNLTGYAHLRKNEQPDWKDNFNMADLKHQTVGLWGMGDTTRHLMRFLAPLRPGRILVCSKHASGSELAQYGAVKVPLEELLRESDIFHCLVGVNRETYRRIGRSELAMMKTGAALVNGGRARLLDNDALIDELKTGRIRAFLDVFESEPLEADSPLVTMDNVILTPHNAGFPGRDRFMPFLLDEFNRFFTGGQMVSEISKARFETMTHPGLRL